MKEYIKDNIGELKSLLKQLCGIPAPSHNEQARAEFVKAWLIKNGVENAYIDEAKNVIVRMGKKALDEEEPLTVFVAHTDTVFPDTEPMPYSEDEQKIYCPGVGDDTTSLAILMMTIKYVIANNIELDGALFVANSCEEGLGNLKGSRTFMTRYGKNVRRFISFDGRYDAINSTCVGSHRYEVTVLTEGGHSYQAFGNKNAIEQLAGIIGEIYKTEVPKQNHSKTTYNVGMISGGTSVNSIAQKASMLCEYRSDDYGCLEIMEKRFSEIFESAKKDGVAVEVKKVGERPCASGVDENKQKELADICKQVLAEVTGAVINDTPSSTDCNIPLSMGIPAVCVGVYYGDGAHTREEWILKNSLETGFEIAVKLVLKLAKGEQK